MKVLNDDGPLRIEDHMNKILVVHKATERTVHETQYVPGSFTGWGLAFERARGFQLGWQARKEAQYKGESE